jgi:alpha-1,3-mannosyltransferase
VRVAHVVSQFHPGKGELESFVFALVKRQRLEGVNAEVITLNRLVTNPRVDLRQYDSVEGVPVRRIAFSGSPRHPIAPGVLPCIEPFDIVHVHGAGFFCYYLAATRHLHRKPLVLSAPGGLFHASFTGFLGRALSRTVTRISLQLYARVFACSANDEAIFRKTPRHLLRIHHGVDTDKFSDLASRKFVPTLVYFGTFAANKGLDRLIDAFDVLCDEIPKARLHLMGRDRGNLLPAIKERIAASRHGRAICVHEDPSDDDIKRVVAKSSFFVSASQEEGLGLTLVEALSAGLLPIVSPIPSFAAILGGSETGIPVHFDDAESAGREMAAFLRDATNRYVARRAAAMQLATSYSWPKVARRFVREYEHILGWREREIFGVRIRPMGRRQALAEVDRAFAAGQRLNVSFANAHTLNLANANDRFRAALQNFLVLNDGLGVDIASRYKFGRPFTANLNGTDFIPDYLASTRHLLRIYLIGTSDAAVTKAAERLRIRYPRHAVVGQRNGFFSGPDDAEDTCQNIRAARADCVLVGMGNPLQELWIDEFGAKTGAKVLFGVGALFDFEAGSVCRAPEWIRSLRCEWVYRLLQEPRRLAHRYLVGNIQFLSRVLVDGQR